MIARALRPFIFHGNLFSLFLRRLRGRRNIGERETSTVSICILTIVLSIFSYNYRRMTGQSNASITYHHNWLRKQIDKYVRYFIGQREFETKKGLSIFPAALHRRHKINVCLLFPKRKTDKKQRVRLTAKLFHRFSKMFNGVFAFSKSI